MPREVNRRDFLTTMAAGTAALNLGGAQPLAFAAEKLRSQPVIGIQIGSISFLDEGVEKVMDNLQERAAVNTLFIATFTYGNGIAGRQLKDHPLPDHGVQNYDDHFHGGNYATPHAQYYKNTVIKDTKAPDHGNLDILEMVFRPLRSAASAFTRGAKTSGVPPFPMSIRSRRRIFTAETPAPSALTTPTITTS